MDKQQKIVVFFLFTNLLICFYPLTSSSFGDNPPEKQSSSDPSKTLRLTIDSFHLGGCAGCHVIPGIPGADGEVGPDLSNLGTVAGKRKSGYSAEQYIRESILDPDAFIAPDGTEDEYPSEVMLKSFGESLGKDELDLIVNYLANLGKSKRETLSVENPNHVSIKIKMPAESNLEPLKKSGLKVPRPAEIILGKYLFFDKRLSSNNSLSCSSCHAPEKGWSDSTALSDGFPSTKLFRNTPAVKNLHLQKEYFTDGRIGDLPSVVRDHLTESHFMAIDGRLLVERMVQIPAYQKLFKQAYHRDPRFGLILNALTAYIRSLNSRITPYDIYLSGNQDAISEKSRNGLELFRGKGGCINCHSGAGFTDQDYHFLDVPQETKLTADPERAITFRRFFRLMGTPNYRNRQKDPGRESVNFQPEDRGKFRTPSLYDVEFTAPYMHNGSLKTLKDVIAFYNKGGGKGQKARLKKLNLSEDEMDCLVAFLKSLSSKQVKVEHPELPPYGIIPRTISGKAEIDSKTIHETTEQRKSIPLLEPLPQVRTPDDNPLTPQKIELGKLLYFDPRLSADGSTSCNTCHPVNTGWTIQTPISMGGPGTSHWRNSQTILNVGYYGKLNWDGAKNSIESQNHGAWTGAVAGNLDPTLGEERMAQIPEYVNRFHQVFGMPLPRWEDALRAVATFQRTIVSENTPFDQYHSGQSNAISPSAKRGLNLFNGKAGCINCHNGPLASDDGFHAIGVPQNPDFLNSPLKQITFRYELASKGVPRKIYQNAYIDEGLYYVTKRDQDRGKFRTPSLRGLVHTGPYMHNGNMKTLEEVVKFYNRGGGNTPNKSRFIKSLQLTKVEQEDLVNFLKTLSGPPIWIKKPDLPEYGTSKSN